jgi:hypothetical protein
MISNDINEKELIFRLAQSLSEELKIDDISKKAATDVRPYARRYAFLRERIISLEIVGSDKFLPELSKEVFTTPFVFSLERNVAERNIAAFDELKVAVSQMVTFLGFIQQNSVKILTELEEFLFKNLRKNIITRPSDEKDIQDVVQIMLNSKDYSYEREKVRISYSSKVFIPDFTFEDLKAALEIKLCKTDRKEKDLIDEINADVLAYGTRFENLTFLIYDMGIIGDVELFSKDIEKNNPRIKILIVKQ